MTELYLRLLDRVLTPVLLVIATVLLLAGHNSPGGGLYCWVDGGSSAAITDLEPRR